VAGSGHWRDTWPHEYVMVKRDGQQALLEVFCERIRRGEGVSCRFSTRPALFLGEHKYGTMTECDAINLNADDCVLNRARLYRDRRDFESRPGDSGKSEKPQLLVAWGSPTHNILGYGRKTNW